MVKIGLFSVNQLIDQLLGIEYKTLSHLQRHFEEMEDENADDQSEKQS